MTILTSAIILAGMMKAFAMTPHQSFSHKVDPVVCMASAIYFEGRNQTEEGQIAIAHVILNSVKSDEFEDTICKVVHRKGRFSYLNEPKIHLKRPIDKDAWDKAVGLAGQVLNEQIDDNTEGALFYCNPTTATRPWCKIAKGAYIGSHKFVNIDAYRIATGG